jgi:hypothetical protein
MRKRIRGELALIGAVFIGANTVQADSSLENTSTINSQSLMQRISEVAALNYYGVYRGAPLSNLKSSQQPTVFGTPSTDPQSIESTLTAGYKFNKDWMAGFVAHFYYFPIGNPVGTGQDLQMYNPWFIVQATNLVNRNGFKLNGRFTAELPVTKVDFLETNGSATALTATMISSYEVPNTSLTLGFFAYARGYIPTGSALDTARTYKIYGAPNLNYQLTKTLAATMWVDLIQLTRYGGSGFISGMKNETVDIEPGINWDITSKLSFNPVLNIYPAHPTLASTSLQAFISAKAF